MRSRLEYAAVVALVKLLGWPPRNIARQLGAAVGFIALRFVPRLRRVGLRNLQLAFPDKPEEERELILSGLYRNLGWLLAEFCQMPRYTVEEARSFVRYEGLQHYLTAREAGKGVLILTGHLGAWELSSFFHSLMGYPMSMVIRRLDNPAVDDLVNGIRCLHGNRVLHKNEFARGLLSAMRAGETVGILMDTNMTPPQGVFVDFFGRPACTASGMARVAGKTGAAVLPGFMLWEAHEGKYVLHFGEPLRLISTGDDEADAVANTALFTRTIEDYIRRYPEQWLWVHRRWKTRPEGERGLYGAEVYTS
ncbi:MAG TPA: lysophospholipid acyltransferase family protein [Acidisarcina sp.]